MMVGMAIQLLRKGLGCAQEISLIVLLRAVTQLYLWFNSGVIQYNVLLQRSDGFVSMKQDKRVLKGGHPSTDQIDVTLP